MWDIHADNIHYVYEGNTSTKVPRTSAIMESAGISNFSMVEKEILAQACAYGTEAHKVMELHDLGDLGDFDEAIQPDLDAWIKFKKEFNVFITPEDVEQAYISEIYGFGCRIDRTPMVRGVRTILDIKTSTQFMRSAAIQTASNMIAYNEAKKGRERAVNRMVVKLNQDGTYSIPPKKFFSATDRAVFLSALTVYQWKLQK